MNHRTRPSSTQTRLQTPSLTSGSARSSSSSMLSSTHDSGLGGSTTVGRSSPPLIDLENGQDSLPRRPLALDAGAGVTAGDKLRALLRQMDAEVRATQPADNIPARPVPIPIVREEDDESSGSRSPPSPPPRMSHLYSRRSSDKSRSDGEDDPSPPRRLPSRVVALNAAAAAAAKAAVEEPRQQEDRNTSALHNFIASRPTPPSGPSSHGLTNATPRPRVSSIRKGKERASEYNAPPDRSTSRPRRESSPPDSYTPTERLARPRPTKTPRRTSIDIPPDTSASFAAGLKVAQEVEPDLDEDSDLPWVEDDESIESSEVSVPIDLQRGSAARFAAAEDESFNRSRESLRSSSFATANDGRTPRPRQRVPTDTSLPSLPDPDSTDDDEDNGPVLSQRAEMFRPSPRGTPESRLNISSRPSSRDPTVYADAPSFASRSWASRSRTMEEAGNGERSSVSRREKDVPVHVKGTSLSHSRSRSFESQYGTPAETTRSRRFEPESEDKSLHRSQPDATLEGSSRLPARHASQQDLDQSHKRSTTPEWEDERSPPRQASVREPSGSPPLSPSQSRSRDDTRQSASGSYEVEETPRRRRRPNDTSRSETSVRSQPSSVSPKKSPNATRDSTRDFSRESRRDTLRDFESTRDTRDSMRNELDDESTEDKQPSLRESIRAGALGKSLAPALRDTSDFRDSQLDLWMGAPQLASLTEDDIDLDALSWQDTSVDRSLDRRDASPSLADSDTLPEIQVSSSRRSSRSPSTVGGLESRLRTGLETPQAVPSTPAIGTTPRPTHLAVEPTPLRSALKKFNSPRGFLQSPGIRWSPEVLANHPDESQEHDAVPEPSQTPPSTPPSKSTRDSTSPTSSPPQVAQTPGMPTPRPPGAWQSPANQVPSTPLPPQPQVSGLQPMQTPGLTPRPPGAWHSPIGRPFNSIPARTSGLRNEWRIDESTSSGSSPTSTKSVASPSIARISTESVHRIRLSPNPKRLQLSAKKSATPATPPRPLHLGTSQATVTPPRKPNPQDPETPPPPSPFNDLNLDPDSSWAAKLKRAVLSPIKPTVATTASLTEAQEALDAAARASAAARLRVASAQKDWLAALAAPEQVVHSARWTFWLGWVALELLLLWGVFRVTIDYATSNSYRAIYDPYARQYAVGIQLPTALNVFAARRRTPVNLFDLLDFLGLLVARGAWRPPT